MRPSPLALAAVLAAVLPASALGATGHWSSPVTITPAGGQLSASAQAFVTPDARSLVLTSDGATPLIAVGDVRGTFSVPSPVGAQSSGLTTFDGAVGADGRVAVAWAAGGTGHVAIGGPGGLPTATTDFPGAGVNSVAVAIGPDGVTTVAFRGKDAATGVYAVSAATAAPGSATFGEPTVIDSGKAGVDAIDVAAGPGASAVVSYRKLAPRFRTFAAVRVPGATTFEAPQGVSGSGAEVDVSPRVAAEADGSFVVAWGSRGGPGYAVRAAGASAFGAPLPLNPEGGDQSQFVDIAATPVGGAAVTWAGNGVVRAATAPAGGTFGAPVSVDSYTGDIVSQPAVTVAPDQTVTVVANHPGDGSIQASDLGGASQVIGYGAAGTLSAVSVASSADRTLAVWKNADGGISAATRSVAAPPSNGPGAKPGPPDTKAPKLTIVGRSRRINFRKIPKTISLKVRCNEACRINAAGSLRLTIGKKRVVSPLRPFTGSKATTKTQTVTLRLGSLAQADLRRAAKRGRGATAYLDLTAADTSAASNQTRLKVQLTLKPAPKKRSSR
jgi:hypothetical protein